MTNITLSRAVAAQMLEALAVAWQQNPHWQITEGMHALRAALTQQAEPDAYGYASRLAVAIWEKHYKDIAPQWKPLDDLMGVLTQIDNMTSGLTRLAQQAEPVEPAFHGFMSADGTRVDVCFTPSAPRTDGTYATAYYTAPPQRKPLTKKEVMDAIKAISFNEMTAFAIASAVERAHGIGEEK